MSENNTKRIAKNTLMLYTRQFLILIVSLYTVRAILNILGVEDYGIYSVVGGVVSFFSFISGTMASATQRFFSYALGKKDFDKLKKTFSTNIIIYLLIIFIALLLLESVGIWFVKNKLKIPDARYYATIYVFQFAICTFIFSMISSPFMAIIIAHEDMQIYAYVSIIEALLKLAIVFLLKLISFDKLILYGVLLLGVSFINAFIYITICLCKYKECQFRHLYFDYCLFKESISFTGWTLFGQITTVVRTQAVTILINQIFSPIVVAARTIATQVTNHINVFATGFNTGLYPPIIKAYAADEKAEMFKLVFYGCKITFFLMWIFALPLFLGMDFVLRLWLKTPPDGAILFTQLALIEAIISTLSLPISTAARAPGKMMIYELSLGIIQILIFLADYLLFKFFSMPAYIVFVVAAIGNLLMFIVRLFLVKRMISFPVFNFIKDALLPICFIILVSFCLSYLIDYFLQDRFIDFLIMGFCSFFISTVSFLYIGLKSYERKLLLEKVKNKFFRR